VRRLAFALLPCVLVACAQDVAVPPPVASIPVPPAAREPSPRAAAASDTSDDAAIERAEKEYVKLLVSISPESATALGDHSRDDELDMYTREGEEADLKREEADVMAPLRSKATGLWNRR